MGQSSTRASSRAALGARPRSATVRGSFRHLRCCIRHPAGPVPGCHQRCLRCHDGALRRWLGMLTCGAAPGAGAAPLVLLRFISFSARAPAHRSSSAAAEPVTGTRVAVFTKSAKKGESVESSRRARAGLLGVPRQRPGGAGAPPTAHRVPACSSSGAPWRCALQTSRRPLPPRRTLSLRTSAAARRTPALKGGRWQDAVLTPPGQRRADAALTPARTIGLSKKGKPCMERSAVVDAATSANTIQAWPRSRYVFIATMSMIFPNWEKMAYRHFFSSARRRTLLSAPLNACAARVPTRAAQPHPLSLFCRAGCSHIWSGSAGRPPSEPVPWRPPADLLDPGPGAGRHLTAKQLTGTRRRSVSASSLALTAAKSLGVPASSGAHCAAQALPLFPNRS